MCTANRCLAAVRLADQCRCSCAWSSVLGLLQYLCINDILPIEMMELQFQDQQYGVLQLHRVMPLTYHEAITHLLYVRTLPRGNAVPKPNYKPHMHSTPDEIWHQPPPCAVPISMIRMYIIAHVRFSSHCHAYTCVESSVFAICN